MPTTAEKKNVIGEAVSAACEQLVAALKEGKSEVMNQYLSTMAAFHSYSFTNMMLIATQRPTATRVAGFNTWRQLGRHVLKGEKGIRIIAPIVSRKKDPSPADGITVVGEEKPKTYLNFRFVHVFDLSQTDGEPLPECPVGRVEGDVAEHFDRLVKHVESLGITLEYREDMEADGLSCGGRIVLKLGMPAAETFSVLVHELAHELLHRGDRRKQTTRVLRETEAEAVAFVICTALGLETNRAAVEYISLYNGDAELLISSLSQIQKTAAGILAALSRKAVSESIEQDQEETAFALPLAA